MLDQSRRWDCNSLFSDAAGQLGDSVRAVEVGPGEMVLGLERWISAAMKCEEMCLDGLEEVGSTGMVFVSCSAWSVLWFLVKVPYKIHDVTVMGN
ncbi:hypothetical protein RHSIM_Rhsim12G0043100 [Rhododendron simsii]|uniref:Pectinesterase inhibitor domain-containing protein n=1 Tax=Rhododendron simsii TaxID=118357 RepID=A0A834G3U3_RHOSS|nr:hypothetical protein RHSIM_Rhsim12G0043100 [Rhododendron simsii]